MAFFRIILCILLFTPAMIILSGCGDDSFLDAMKEEEDFIAPFDVVLTDDESTRTVYFNVSDTGQNTSFADGDDASYSDMPSARSFTERLNVNSTSGDVIDDNVTGLTWTKCTSNGFKSMKIEDDCSDTPDIVEMTWNEAYTTCDTLSYAGYDDWRLPSLSELITLLDFSGTPYVNLTYFPDTAVDVIWSPLHMPAYWTATSRVFLMSDSYAVTDYGWIVYFAGGGPFNILITNYMEKLSYDSGSGTTTPSYGFVRCVRGGL